MSFSVVLREPKLSVVVFSPLRVSHFAIGICPLSDHRLFCWGDVPRLRTDKPTTPFTEPTGGWTLSSFPLSGSFHIPMMGRAPTKEIALLKGYSLHERTTLMLGLLSRWRYRIVDRVGDPIRDRHIQPVIGTSDQFVQVPSDYGYIPDHVYLWGFPCLVFTSTYQFHLVIHPMVLSRIWCYMYNLRTTRISSMI